jgi:hypothetical protein
MQSETTMVRLLLAIAMLGLIVPLARTDETPPPPLADDPGANDADAAKLGAVSFKDSGLDSMELRPFSAFAKTRALTKNTGAPPPADDEELPAPTTATPIEHPTPIFFRINYSDVWQNYAVDRNGFWRPRVIYSPWGAYYRANGVAYPWAEIHGLYFTTYAGDWASGSLSP